MEFCYLVMEFNNGIFRGDPVIRFFLLFQVECNDESEANKAFKEVNENIT